MASSPVASPLGVTVNRGEGGGGGVYWNVIIRIWEGTENPYRFQRKRFVHCPFSFASRQCWLFFLFSYMYILLF